MDAASSHQVGERGAPRLLQDCAAVARITASRGPSARARLERELGCELTELLVGALAHGRGARPPFASV
jgi:hypothetical protein